MKHSQSRRFDSNGHSEVNVAGNGRAEGTEEAVGHETTADEVDANSDGLQQKSRDLARTGKGSAPGLGLRETRLAHLTLLVSRALIAYTLLHTPASARHSGRFV